MRPWVPFLVLFFSQCLLSQTVVRIVKNYVLIDTDRGIGALGDRIRIHRSTDGGLFEVGVVELVRFQNGLAAGKIVEQRGSARIRVGDVVVRNQTSTRFEQPVTDQQDRINNIIRVVSKYVLIDSDSGMGRIDDVLDVRRWVEDAFVVIGKIRLLRFSGGKAAAKIIREIPPYRIMIGDVIMIADHELDIDTYYLDDFRFR